MMSKITSIDKFIPQNMETSEYITNSTYSLRNMEPTSSRLNQDINPMKQKEPKIKEFVIHEE